MKLAEIFVAVRPDTRKTGSELKSNLGRVDTASAGKKAGDNFSKGFASGTRKLVGIAAGALAGRAVVNKVRESVAAASDLNETVSKSQAVFGGAQKVIDRFASNSATAIGQSKNEAIGAAAQFGNMFNQLGIGQKPAADMSVQMVRLASDFASFHNADITDVLQAQQAAFRGEFDSVQRFVPTLNAAAVEQEVLRSGMAKTKDEITDQDKAIAVQTLLMRGAGKAQGDFAKTSTGLANQQRIASAQSKDLSAAFGKSLLPIWLSATTILNTQLLPPLTALATKHGPGIAAAFTNIATAAGPFIDGALARAAERFSALAHGSDEASPALAQITTSTRELAPVVSELVNKIPSFTDVLRIGATVMGFFANNVDLLRKLLPLIVAGFVAYKAAQLAANLAATLSVPTKIAEVIVNRQLVKSNRELIASRAGVVAGTVAETVATSANTGAKGAGVIATLRLKAASIAHAAATKAVALATKAWTAAQWLINFALTANPIGLVIVGIAALIAIIIVAWKRSQTFRTIVTGAFNAIKDVGRAAFAAVVDTFLGFVETVIQGAAKAFGWVPKLGGKLRTAASDFSKFRDDVNRRLAGVKDRTINITPTVGVPRASAAAARRQTQDRGHGILATGGPAIGGGPVDGPGTTTNDKAGLFALSVKEWVIKAASSMKYGARRMKAINDGTATVLAPGESPFGFAGGGSPGLHVRTRRQSSRAVQIRAEQTANLATSLGRPLAQSIVNAAYGLSGVLKWVASQVGKPYLWGGVGPKGYDCSGLVSAAINKAFNRSPHRRLGATGSMPWSMFAAGPGRFMVGWFKGNPGHTAATVNGVNIESSGGVGVHMGRSARGANNRLFNRRMHVRGLAGGGSAGDLPFDIVDPRGAHFAGRDLLEQLGIKRGGVFDSGYGTILRGTSLVQNNTGRDEPMRRTDMPTDLSDATLRRLGKIFANALRDAAPRGQGTTSWTMAATNG